MFFKVVFHWLLAGCQKRTSKAFILSTIHLQPSGMSAVWGWYGLKQVVLTYQVITLFFTKDA